MNTTEQERGFCQKCRTLRDVIRTNRGGFIEPHLDPEVMDHSRGHVYCEGSLLLHDAPSGELA